MKRAALLLSSAIWLAYVVVAMALAVIF